MAKLATKQLVMRSWGHYQVLAKTPALKFKKLVLLPGKSTSVQYHHHRNEFWTVLAGKGEALIGDTVHPLAADITVWVSAGIVHQLSNTGHTPLIIHEVQQGSYLEEDDIVRLNAHTALPNVQTLSQNLPQRLPSAA